MIEGTIEGYLYDKCKKAKLECLKVTSKKGIPDRLIAGNGQFCFVELKTKTGRPTKQQLLTHKQLREKNIPVLIINSNEQIKKLIELFLTKNVNKEELKKIECIN